MRRWLLVGVLALLVAGASTVALAGGHSPHGRSRRAGRCSVTVTPAQGAGALASAIAQASGGATVCLAGGHYGTVAVHEAKPGGWVTVRPRPGAVAVVAGMELADSSFLRFEGLHMSEGFNVVGSGEHLQWLGNVFEDPAYALTLYGEQSPIRAVLFAHNYVHNATLGTLSSEAGEACSSGYSRGEDVVVKYAEGVKIADNTFDEADEHYIQGASAGAAGMTVTHNLFEGYYKYGCAHLNVWQIFAGGTNDTFSDNVVVGKGVKYGVGPFATGSEEASGDGLEFENGPGSAECSAGPMRNTVIENNLWVDGASAQPMQIFTTQGLVIRDNTVVRAGYGTWVLEGNEEAQDGQPRCGPSTGVVLEGNIDVDSQQSTSNEDFLVDGAGPGMRCAHNVSSDRSAATIRGCEGRSRPHWRPRWREVRWDPFALTARGERFPRPPRGYYVARGLPFAAGYQGGGGP